MKKSNTPYVISALKKKASKDCQLCGHPWTSEHGERGKPKPPLNYELLLIRTDILGLIKRVAKKVKTARNMYGKSLTPYWDLVYILRQLTYIYRHNGGKV